MTVGASAEGRDDIINTSITDVATGNMASYLSGYENSALISFHLQAAVCYGQKHRIQSS